MLSTSVETTLASTASRHVLNDDLSDINVNQIRWADDEVIAVVESPSVTPAKVPLQAAPCRRSMLVGVDGTEPSAAALRWAIGQSERFGKIVSASAWQYPWWAVVRPETGAPIARPEGDFVRHAAKRAAATLRLGGIKETEHLVLEGPTGPMLVAESAASDLLIVGSCCRGQVSETFLGSVSGYCVANSRVPVAVVPPKGRAQGVQRVVVGVDESAEAASALRWAVRHFGNSFTIDVVHVVADRATGYLDSSGRWLDRMVAEVAGSSNGIAPQVSGRIECGDPAVVLRNAAAAPSDVLVVGARGRGRLAHALVGSVTTSLCRQPDVATIVVPEQGM